MLHINYQITPNDLQDRLNKFWQLSGEKIRLIEINFDKDQGSPVFTENGKYTSMGWTEWTEGFQYGSALLQFEATGEGDFLAIGRDNTVKSMASHITHAGVHDHGFNNISTYGNLLRLMNDGKIQSNIWEKNFYELAIKLSGAVQAMRWTSLNDHGFIYSFNGPHSLFIDTIRTVRILLLSYKLGHFLYGENDIRINLFDRAMQHARTTAKFSVYYGEKRDIYDVSGRVAHESIFNVVDGSYRSPNSQQGYSGRTTWTRGLAWAILGFSELLEFVSQCTDEELNLAGGRFLLETTFVRAATVTCDYYMANTPIDGIPYWDMGAPGLSKMGEYLEVEADPFNDLEPVDSSAAVIAAQGFLRLGTFFRDNGDIEKGNIYYQAGLTIFSRLLDSTYLCDQENHQGLVLHSIYHRPNGWDYTFQSASIPQGESSMWGDYHARELALYVQKVLNDEKYYTFFNFLY